MVGVWHMMVVTVAGVRRGRRGEGLLRRVERCRRRAARVGCCIQIGDVGPRRDAIEEALYSSGLGALVPAMSCQLDVCRMLVNALFRQHDGPCVIVRADVFGQFMGEHSLCHGADWATCSFSQFVAAAKRRGEEG